MSIIYTIRDEVIKIYYKYDENNSIHIPAPFCRTITPVFMKDDFCITDCNFSIHITEWPAGSEIDEHFHPDSFEAMYLMSGTGKCIINDEEHDFIPDSMIVAPPNVNHKIMNTGQEVLRVLCVFSPPITGESLKKRAMEAVIESQNNGVQK